MKNLTDKILSYGIGVLIFLLPFFFLPLTPDFYYFNKLVLLVIASCLLLIVHLLGESGWKIEKGDLSVLVFLAVNLVSTFLNPHPVEAMYGQTGLILGLTLLYFLLGRLGNLGSLGKRRVATALLGAVVVLSVIAFYQAVGLEEITSPLAGQLTIRLINPAGSRLTLATFLIVSLPLLLRFFKKALRGRKLNPFSRTLYLLSLSLGLPALILTLYQLIKEPPAFLPLRANWQITVEGFKNFRNLIFGVGPANFLWAFTRAKPLYLNQTPLWNTLFFRGRSEYLHLLSTTGVLGLVSFVWLVLGRQGRLRKEFRITFWLILSLFLIFPGNFLLWLMLYLCLGQGGKGGQIAQVGEVKRVPSRFLLLLPIPLLAGFIYLSGRAWWAEHLTFKSALAAAENKGKETFELQQEAIRLNPYLDRYHLNFANTCFLLANVLAGKSDLTDQDRQTITVLIQQAINQTRITTTLAPHKASNWWARANLYRNLINFASGADSWTISCYQKALSLDPANPVLRVNYGGLFYLYQNYETAIEQFKLAVQVKPDYANGWYNLAAAYRENGNLQQAAFSLQQVLNFLPEDSPDRPQAEKELEELKKQIAELPAAEPQPSEPQEALSLPESPPATPSGVTPIELPSPPPEPSPPPTPSPTVTPTEVPSPSPEASPTATVTP